MHTSHTTHTYTAVVFVQLVIYLVISSVEVLSVCLGVLCCGYIIVFTPPLLHLCLNVSLCHVRLLFFVLRGLLSVRSLFYSLF